MRLGPKERAILLACSEDGWTPPSAYLGEYGNCPSGYTLDRIVYEKKLAEFRYMTWTPEQCREEMPKRAPGRETAEYNAALRLTPAGIAARKALQP